MEVTKMTIEPLASVMSMQAQTSIPKSPSVSAEKTAEFTSANVQPVDKIDATTAVVENVQGKEQYSKPEQSDQQASKEQIKKAVEKLNKKLDVNSEAVFGIHEETNRVTIKIVDRSTKEVIKELPPEKTLDMIAKVWEMAGILVDEKR